jgi:cytochrome c oxidase subunit 2
MYSSTGIGASNFVGKVDSTFILIIGISILFLVGLTITMIYFIFRYNRKRNPKATQIEGSLWLELLWTIIPVILALLMFYFGWAGWKPMVNPPKDAFQLTSTARMWNFSFQYPNGKTSQDLIVPVNEPVRIKLVAMDVLHSMFIPAFRLKEDMVPGRDKIMWFIPQAVGDYDIYCAEYCGLQHSYMNATLKVLSKEEFTSWYADTSLVEVSTAVSAPVSEGMSIMQAQGCNACHSSDGSKIIGPSYLHLFGKEQTVIRDGKEVTITVDEEYIRKSILDPNSEIVRGYPKGLMQSYEGILKDEDIAKIIEYLKSLNEK